MIPESLKEINEEEGVVLLSINSVMRIIYSYFGVILFVSLVVFALDWVADFLESDKFDEIEEISTFIAELIRVLIIGIGGTVGIAIFIKLFADTWGSMAYNKSLNQDAAMTHFKNPQLSHLDEISSNSLNANTDISEARNQLVKPPSADLTGPTGPPPPNSATGPTGPPAPPTQLGYQNSQIGSTDRDLPPPSPPNSREKLYELITSQGHNIGDFSFFDERMRTDEGRRLFFNHAIQNSMPVGTWESFEQKMKR